MSPEQAAGGRLSVGCDWYAVGVILFQSLTGRLPFQGSPLEIISQKQSLPSPEPRALVSTVPEDLNQLCNELLHRDPRRRPARREILRRIQCSDKEGSSTDVRLVDSPDGSKACFVGRERELALLNEFLSSPTLGNATSVYISGTSGSGKSALVRNFITNIDHHGEVVALGGRCYERESSPVQGSSTA